MEDHGSTRFKSTTYSDNEIIVILQNNLNAKNNLARVCQKRKRQKIGDERDEDKKRIAVIAAKNFKHVDDRK